MSRGNEAKAQREVIMRDAAALFVSEALCDKAMVFLRSRCDEWARQRKETSEFKLQFTDDHNEFVAIYEGALDAFVLDKGYVCMVVIRIGRVLDTCISFM
jgi:hypothetical protein